MPATASASSDADETPATLVARFLRSNHYTQTLDAFLAEANLPPSTGADTSRAALTIETVLQEKKVFDLSVRFERAADLDDARRGWLVPSPSTPTPVPLPATASNILNATIETITTDPNNTSPPRTALIVSTAARGVHFLAATPPHAPLALSLAGSAEAPTLAWALLRRRFLLTAAMSGRVALYDLAAQALLDERRDHAKYVVRVAASEDASGAWIATAAWDARVLLYRMQYDARGDAQPCLRIGEAVAEIQLQTLPEAIQFVPHPELTEPVLLVTRRDSTFLYFYGLPEPEASIATSDSGIKPLPLLGRQNLAPHSNAWIAFTPSSVALHPKDPTLVAVATSHTPHMKLITARLLLPPPGGDPFVNAPISSAPPTASLLDPERGAAAAEARRLLAVQDREDAAIISQTSTRAAQTGFSTPVVVWRPGASGVWVNGDDGVVRGVEASSGKVVATLGGKTGGHEPGAKVRTIWAGMIGEEEVMISGGFDRRLVLWEKSST